MGYANKSKYSIGRIIKTPTEIKQDRLIAKHQRAINPKIKKKPKVAIKDLNKIESAKFLRTLDYNGFLNSKYWARVRKLVLKRDEYKCIICKSPDFLQIHHDTYKNHFDELNHLEDLMTLCRSCHKEHHYAQN